jgi:hypothetical protein
MLAAIGLAAASLASPAAAAPGSRAAICSVRSVTVSFARASIVAANGRRTLARATRRARSVSGSCEPTHDRGFARALLTSNGRRGVRIRCEGDFRKVVVEVDAVRSAAGRLLGSRLAVWRGAFPTDYATGGEIAEGFIGHDRSWFSYYPGICHAV